jgi:hypothetical protein
MPLPWAAMGIGALIGGMTSKQRGGNFLKGALQGAALGGITGGLGAKFGGAGAGKGIFGWGAGWKAALAPMAMIGMGSEMLGQSDANKQRMLQQRKWLDEEEERRIARLNKMAGYDVSKARLTPETYFMASGGITNMPQYANGGWHNVPGEEPGPTMDPEIMQLPMGQEGSFESENEDFLELAGLTDEEMSELQALQSLSIVTPEGDPNYERIQLRLQELMGRMKVAKGGQINRPGYDRGGNIHPGTEDEGYTYDIDNRKYNFDELLPEDPEERKRILEILQLARAKQPEGRLLQDTVDTMDQQMSMLGDIPNPMMYRAQGGIADLDMRGGGHSIGPGTGTSDDVPAMLSDGEFVMTANAVSNLGGGDRMLGARRMYSMMNQLDPNSQTPGEMNVAGYG